MDATAASDMIGAMTEFAISLLCFLAAHVVPSRTGLRDRAIERIGRGPYMVAYSALSLVLVAWIVVAARDAPHVALWPRAGWQNLVPIAIMPVALIFLAAGLVQPNPLSISTRSAAPGAPLADSVRVTRHPVLWGFGLWALAHLPPNGDLVSVILFGGMAVFAFAGMAVFDRRSRRVLGDEAWRRLAAQTSVIPFAAALGGRTRLSASAGSLLAVAVALAIYAALVGGGHTLLFGVDPLAIV